MDVMSWMLCVTTSVKYVVAVWAVRWRARLQSHRERECVLQASGGVAEVVVERLLGGAVADSEFAVRRKVLWEMRNNPALDALLAQADW